MGELSGGCFCGEVTYTCDGIGPIGHCHCRTCQKTHSAAFTSTARTPAAGFKWTKGADVVTFIESSPGKKRWFCPKCGTHMVAEREGVAHMILRVASLNSPLPTSSVVHIWTSHKAEYFDFEDGLPQFPEFPPQA